MQIKLVSISKVILASCLAVFTLASCSRQPLPDPNPGPTPSMDVLPAIPEIIDTPVPATSQPAYATKPPATKEAVPSNTQYSLNAILNYAQHMLTVEEHIRYANRSSEPITEMLLVVEPAYYPGAFNLESLSWDDGQAIQAYAWDESFLTFPLQQPLEPNQEIALKLNYQLQLPSPVPSAETRPVPFGYTARQANLVDWYPYIPPYITGKGWLAHRAGFFGEHQVYESSDFTVTVQIADQDRELIVAASAPDEGAGGIHQYSLKNARNFVWSASPEYQVKSTRVGDITVISYSFAYHELAGEAALQTTAEALELYSRLFGSYSHRQISVVEADFLDGMEYEGLYFLSNGFYNLYQGTPAEYLIAIAAHETAHQWWYALVGNDQALEPWLDEALCTYSEKIYFENLHPDALDWWWEYRVKYYNPRGWVNGSIYNPDGYRAYRDAVYLNGALFLEDLRNLIGDEPFMESLQDYARLYAHRIATTSDFFNVVEEHTQMDLKDLRKQYFYQP